MTKGLPTKRARHAGAVDFPDRLPDFRKAAKAPKTGVLWPSLVVVVLGFGLIGGLGFWASVAPISSAVVAGGAFEVEGDAQVVQHLEGGIVTGLHVREGQTVAEGALIATIEDARTQAQHAILQNQLAAALARAARLEAEYLDQPDVDWPDELVRMVAETPDLGDHIASQGEIFRSNRTTDDGQIQILNERISQLSEQLAGFEERRSMLTIQRGLVQEELSDLSRLFEDGLVTRARLVARQEDVMELSALLSDAAAERQTVLQQIAEVREQQLQISRERKLQNADALQQAKEQVLDLRQRIAAAENIISRQRVTAPIAGRIVGFELNTIGAIVAPGQQILRIVPDTGEYIVVARVSPADIDEVAMGLPVRVRLSAYSYRKTPPVKGEVVHVSADSFFDDANGSSYFEVHVSVAAEVFHDIGLAGPVAGMPAQVMIETGEQTIMTYLLDPVIGGLEVALVERE